MTSKWPKKSVVNGFHVIRCQNHVPVVSKRSRPYMVRLMTFTMECGHQLQRIVVDRPWYGPTHLLCEKCEHGPKGPFPDRTARTRPHTMIYPVGKHEMEEAKS